jgi:hypothetical protein
MSGARRAGVAAGMLCALAALGLAGLGCGKTELAVARPHALVSPAALDFGKAPLHLPLQLTLTITNAGSAPLHLSGGAIGGADAGLFAAGPIPLQLEASASGAVTLTFTPQAAGAAAALFTLDTDDPDVPRLAVPLAGEGVVSGSLSVSPAALSFGRVGEGTTSVQELTLTSAGPGDLYLSQLSFTSSTPAAYGILGSARTPATLPAGTSVKLAVRFSPLPQTASGDGVLQLFSSDAQRGLLAVPLQAAINRAPVALARGSVLPDPPQAGALTVAVGATLALDASASTDPDGDLPLAFTWSLPLRPGQSQAAIQQPSASAAALLLDQPGLYSVLLDAQDATGLASLAPSRLDIHAVPPLQLMVQLVWDQERPDLDLHLLEQPGAALGSPADCGWTNPDPNWFAGGADANPHLLGDQLVGFGPETIQWKAPAGGTYGLAVVYKAANGLQPADVTARVRVTAFGILVAELSKVLHNPGEVWSAGTVEWPTGRVTGSAP